MLLELDRNLFNICCIVLKRANERLKKARVLHARPDAEKAARTQELHKKLRVS